MQQVNIYKCNNSTLAFATSEHMHNATTQHPNNTHLKTNSDY